MHTSSFFSQIPRSRYLRKSLSFLKAELFEKITTILLQDYYIITNHKIVRTKSSKLDESANQPKKYSSLSQQQTRDRDLKAVFLMVSAYFFFNLFCLLLISNFLLHSPERDSKLYHYKAP